MAVADFFNTAVCAEILALVAATLLLVKGKNSYWKLFIVYLALLLLAEWLGFSFSHMKISNYPVYHSLMLVQASFFFILFYQFQESAPVRFWLLVIFISFFNFFLLEALLSPTGVYYRYSRLLLSFIIVFFSCTFYMSILKADSIRSPLYHPPFWIVTGLFFYYFGTAVMFAFYDSVSKIKITGNINFYSLVMGCLSCILYGTWIIGFIWRKKQTIPLTQ